MPKPLFPCKAFNYSFSSKGLPAFAAEYHRQDAQRLLSEEFQLPEGLVSVTCSPSRAEDHFQFTAVTGAGKTDPGGASIVAARLVLPRLRRIRALAGTSAPWRDEQEGFKLACIASGHTPCPSRSLEHFYMLWRLGQRQLSDCERVSPALAASLLNTDDRRVHVHARR